MIILAFTDVHGDERALAHVKKMVSKADLIICAGDITVFETHLRKMLSIINSFEKPVLMLHGNHEGDHRMKKECEHFKNIIFFHKGFYEQDGIVFAGYGGGGFAMRDKQFVHFSKKVKEKAKDKGLVLVLHGPPYGTKTDRIGKEHAGNKSYTDFIEHEKPNLVICGHLHENNGVQDKIGHSLIINPGPGGRLLHID
jgi:uncharacterized protein